MRDFPGFSTGYQTGEVCHSGEYGTGRGRQGLTLTVTNKDTLTGDWLMA